MKYYYKLINNETNEIESYVESSGCIRPENICHILGLSGYHAVSCTKQEYEEKPTAENTVSTAEAILSELKDIKSYVARLTGFVAELAGWGQVDGSKHNEATVCDMQEIKHGSWEYDSEGVGYANYLCSECGNFLTFYEDIDLYPYCPYCGARMDKE